MFTKKIKKQIEALEGYLGVAFTEGRYDGEYVDRDWSIVRNFERRLEKIEEKLKIK